MTRARGLYDRGLAAIGSGRPAEGARLLKAGLRRLGDPPDPAERPLAARLLTSLAAAEVQLGNHRTGFELLDRAKALASPAEAGLVMDQRGLILLLVGRLDDALAFMNRATPLLRAAGDPTPLARNLLNRAMLHDLAGRIRAAMADLAACEQVARSPGVPPRILAKVHLNRGHCQTMLGDIPAALCSFDSARAGLTEHAPDLLAVLAVDKARALLAAGLATEAAADLDAAITELAGRPPTHERAEAELVRAQIALVQGDAALARRWARRSERSFRRRGNDAWAELCVLITLRADFLSGGRHTTQVAEVCALAERLTALSLPHDAEHAELLAAEICLSSHRHEDARRHLSARKVARPTTETKLVRKLVKAQLHAAEGDIAQTYAQVRAGLTLLRQHREQFGSIDLQTGTAALGVRLADLGLATALRHGGPAVVFDWLERSRAQAFRLRPVSPPPDEATADVLAELRRCAMEARVAQLAGRRDPTLERRCVDLEHQLRSHEWRSRGSTAHAPTARLSDVVDELRREGATLVSFIKNEAGLHALVVNNRATRLVEVGHVATVTESIARLRADLNALCGRQLRPELEHVVRESVRRRLLLLADSLVQPLLPWLDGSLVIVPTGPLSAVPWGLMAPLRGRPVTVAPSATVWLTGRRDREPFVRRPLLVAGPGLRHAWSEVRGISRVATDATVLCGPAASVSATLAASDGRDLVHFAAHGHHEDDNVLFSRLDLADGPLMAYDLHHLRRPPKQVVLSSCDIGRAVVRSGDEVLGFTAALLYSGTRTVIAGVASLPDSATTAEVMTRYHRSLVSGTPPAQALSDALASQPFLPLVCFGS